MTEEDPRPLKAGRDAPPELVRALRALGKRDRDSARLARVAGRLGGLLDAPPPAPTSGLRKLLGTKSGITGIVIGLAGLGLLAYELAMSQPEPSVPEPPATQPAPLQPAAAAASPAPPPTAASELPEARTPSGTNRRARRHAASTRASANAPHAVSSPDSAPAASGSAFASSGTAQGPSDSTPAPSEAPKPPAAEEKSPIEPPPAAQQARPRSEVQLLFEARKALPSEPAAALRLLDEHAARFRSGQLAPEREVLAIEALRALGRDTEAAQRLQRFQTRYPRSIHLQRLQEKN